MIVESVAMVVGDEISGLVEQGARIGVKDVPHTPKHFVGQAV